MLTPSDATPVPPRLHEPSADALFWMRFEEALVWLEPELVEKRPYLREQYLLCTSPDAIPEVHPLDTLVGYVTLSDAVFDTSSGRYDSSGHEIFPNPGPFVRRVWVLMSIDRRPWKQEVAGGPLLPVGELASAPIEAVLPLSIQLRQKSHTHPLVGQGTLGLSGYYRKP